MGRRKKNNKIKAQERVKSLAKQAMNKLKRERKGQTAGQKLAEKMAK